MEKKTVVVLHYPFLFFLSFFFVCLLLFLHFQPAAKLGHRKRMVYLQRNSWVDSVLYIRGKQLWVQRVDVKHLFHAKIGRLSCETHQSLVGGVCSCGVALSTS